MADTPVATISLNLSPRRMNLTEANFLKAVLGTALVVFVFWLGYYIERNILNRHPESTRFIREASEAAMRYITIPHIIIGFLFMWSSPKNRTAAKRRWVFALLVIGAALCTFYGIGGGKTNAVLYLGVYLYFLVHEMRDEAMFYHALGDAASITDRAAFDRMVKSFIGLLIFSVAAVVWAAVPFGAYQTKTALPPGVVSTSFATALTNGSLPLPTKLILSLLPVAVAAIGFRQTLTRSAARLGYANVGTLLRTHATLFKVLIGVVAVLGAAIVITRRPFALILFHVVAWYVFASYQLHKHPPKTTPTSLWMWMRTTPAGFKTLHIGMAVILMAIGLVWTLGLGQTPYLKWLLAPEAFLYWTIMHITVSFVPR